MSGNDDSYTPIDCGVYSEYEVAILHRRPMRVHWQDDEGADHIDNVTPRDLVTEDKREYLIADKAEGGELKVRLDRILKAAVADL